MVAAAVAARPLLVLNTPGSGLPPSPGPARAGGCGPAAGGGCARARPGRGGDRTQSDSAGQDDIFNFSAPAAASGDSRAGAESPAPRRIAA